MPARAGLALLLLGIVSAGLTAGQGRMPGAAFDVDHYEVHLSVDVAAGTIAGRERIDLTARDAIDALVFDSGALTVDSVAAGANTLAFKPTAPQQTTIALPTRARAGERLTVDIAYHGAPRRGLTLDAAKRQAYTTFSTSQWMVAVDAPADRATLDLEVTVPSGWSAAGTGREVRRDTGPRGTTYRWRLERDAPSYLFGFVAGDFTEAADAAGGLDFRYLGAGFSAGELRRVFRDTPAVARFFGERAGIPYPATRYTQALVATSGGQELAGLAHMPEAYGRAVLADPGDTSLLAHELAHQWWGNSLTCRDWTDFWLNEGFATFMASAYKEQAQGLDAYLADVSAWRRRVERLRADAADKALIFPDWKRPTADDRAVVYQKGALALHELRELLGDAPFWTAIRAYTSAHAGAPVTTADFRRAVERSSGRRLDDFFATWVYPPQPSPAAN